MNRQDTSYDTAFGKICQVVTGLRGNRDETYIDNLNHNPPFCFPQINKLKKNRAYCSSTRVGSKQVNKLPTKHARGKDIHTVESTVRLLLLFVYFYASLKWILIAPDITFYYWNNS